MLQESTGREKDGAILLRNMALYSIVHALVDFTCAAVILSKATAVLLSEDSYVFMIILYNIIAFALQAPLGYLVDKLRKPVQAALLSYFFLAAGVLLRDIPQISVCFLGLGNALFHLGGGIVTLNLKPGKALLPGIYVAPGAAGLFLGTIAGRAGYVFDYQIIIMLIAAGIMTVVIKPPQIYTKSGEGISYDKFELIILLLFLSVGVRGYAGMALNYPWKADLVLLTAFTSAVVLGKALGGFLGDKLGWTRVSVSGLVIASLLLFFGFQATYLGIAGILLFNMTMPITLTAMANMLPGREGFAFGLTTMALSIGALPVFFFGKAVNLGKWSTALTVLILALVLYEGLKIYFKSREGYGFEEN